MTQRNRCRPSVFRGAFLPALFQRAALIVPMLVLSASVSADTIVWSGGNTNVSFNWSETGNWFGGVVPSSADDVKFFEAGATAVANITSTIADAAFPGTIASLHFGQTNGTHTLEIPADETLEVNGAGGLRVGTLGDPGVAKSVTNSITGAGTLFFNNSSANFVLNQGGATAAGRALLDMSGLDTFVMNASRIGIGTTTLPNPANQRLSGILHLARTNLISLATSASGVTYRTVPGQSPAIEMSHNPGNNAGMHSFLYLGQTNAFFIDSIAAGRTKASASAAATVQFNPQFTNDNPVAFFRGNSGPSSRVTWWSIGDMCTHASSAQVSVGTNNFTGGTVYAWVDTLSLARDTVSSHSAGNNTIVGVLTFDGGWIDANDVFNGNQSLGPTGSTTPMLGIINVNGTGTLVVNSNLTLGFTTVNSVAATRASGVLNIDGGTVLANQINVGASSTNNVITVNEGTLTVSNSIASPARGLTRLNATNATFNFSVANLTNVVVTNLITGGDTNLININSAAIFDSYPRQVSLIRYSGSIGGNGFNFGLGTVPGSVIGFLSNNVANGSIDLYLSTDPRPVITGEPVGIAVDPGAPASFTVVASGVPALAYQWQKDGTNLVDGGTLSGSATATLSISSAQPSDNGNYTVIVTNQYGAATSQVAVLYASPGDLKPFISIHPQSLTVLSNENVTFSVSGAGKPQPEYHWLKNGEIVSGANASSFMIDNAQLGDEAGYSVILSNSVGSVTSLVATLTVNIPPTISEPPANVAVLNGAAALFSVAAAGKPAPDYQWLKNGSPIPGASGSTLSFGATVPADAATYSVTVANSAGSVTSDAATLVVNSSMSVTSLSPANNAAGICPDTPLRVTFDAAPVLGNAGRIRIYNATNTETPVEIIDLSASGGNGAQPRTIGGATYNAFPIMISGQTATIFPRNGALKTNETYYVTIENVVNGAFKDAAGATFAGISASNVWRFTTKPVTPANETNIVVAADGSGDFCTVQGAADFVPAGNTTPRTIHIRNGTYTEIVYVNNRHHLTFVGQNRDQTLITYANNDVLNGGTSLRPSFRLQGSDNALVNLTLTNATPKGGSQAEALRTDGKRIVLLNVRLASFQDTMLNNNSGDLVYMQDSLIQGDTDFIWGGSTLFVTNSEIRTLNGGTQITQARTAAGTNGFSFVNCRLTRAGGGVTGCGLGRSLGFSDGNVAWINCLIDAHITGWADALARSWEFGNSNITATANVAYNGTQLAAGDPNLTNAMSAPLWLYGWEPQVAPVIVSQPSDQLVAAGGTAIFTVSALGISSPAYQWEKDGETLEGETSATLVLNNVNAGNAGVYRVVVTNSAGTVISAEATLAVPNSAPTLQTVADRIVDPGANVSITNVAADVDVPAQALTFALLAGPTNAVLDANGVFMWRPLVTQADTTNVVTVTVTDDGSPSLSATNSFAIVVNPLTLPILGAPASSGGEFSFVISGQATLDYAVQVSTNLASGIWTTVLTTNSPALPFTFVDTNGSAPAQFYRVLVGPPLPIP